MKFRHPTGSDDKITLQMTPMIDIVFQLLVFFVFSFKIGAQEGDFNVKMPLPSNQVGVPPPSSILNMQVRLIADETGKLRQPGGIVVNGEMRFDTIQDLHNYVVGIVGGDEPAAREEAEVELDCDFDLHYEHVVQAITAVSGYVDRSTRKVNKLIERIKFAPPAAPPES
jgi:biopolymer transport protein ExbD